MKITDQPACVWFAQSLEEEELLAHVRRVFREGGTIGVWPADEPEMKAWAIKPGTHAAVRPASPRVLACYDAAAALAPEVSP